MDEMKSKQEKKDERNLGIFGSLPYPEKESDITAEWERWISKAAELNDEQKKELVKQYNVFTLNKSLYISELGSMYLPKEKAQDKEVQSLISQFKDLNNANSPIELWDKLTNLEKDYRDYVTTGRSPTLKQYSFMENIGIKLGKVKPEYNRQAVLYSFQDRKTYVNTTLEFNRLSIAMGSKLDPKIRNAANTLMTGKINTPEELAAELRALEKPVSNMVQLKTITHRQRLAGEAMLHSIYDHLYKLDPTQMERNYGDFRKNQKEFLSKTMGLGSVSQYIDKYKEIRKNEETEARKLNESKGVQLSEKEEEAQEAQKEKEYDKLRNLQSYTSDFEKTEIKNPTELQTKLTEIEKLLQGVVRKINTPQATESLLKLSRSLDQADPKRFEKRVNAAADKASQLKTELLATKSGFRGLFVKDTEQGVAMENALKEFADIAAQRAENPERVTKSYDVYLEKLKKSVDDYLDYKKDHMNGSVADKRFALAEKLRDFVEEEQNALYVDNLIAEPTKDKAVDKEVKEPKQRKTVANNVESQNTIEDMRTKAAELKEDEPYKQILNMAIEAKERMQKNKIPYKELQTDMKVLILERQLAESQQEGNPLPEQLSSAISSKEGLKKYIDQVDLGEKFNIVKAIVTPYKNSQGKNRFHENAPKVIRMFAYNNYAQKIYDDCKTYLKESAENFLNPKKQIPQATQQTVRKEQAVETMQNKATQKKESVLAK